MGTSEINELVFEAQRDSGKLNKLIEDSQPLIKRCISQIRETKQSQEDALTIAMMTFANCIKMYQVEKGSFLAFVFTAIRNRLIDDYRSEQRFTAIHLPYIEENAASNEWEEKLSVANYQDQQQKVTLQYEIQELSEILSTWNTSFTELSKICPKQKRTRSRCEYVVTALIENKEWKKQLIEKHRMPTKDIFSRYGISKKFLEKYKKYIVVLCIIRSGDYPMLKAFLPTTMEVDKT